MKASRPIEDLVRTWLDKAAPLLGHGDWFGRTPRLLDDPSAPSADQKAYSDSTRPILDALGSEWATVEEDDLTWTMVTEALQVFSEGALSELSASQKKTHLARRIVDRLLLPKREYSFSTPLALGGSIPVVLEIGGPQQLKLENRSRGPGRGVELSGTVTAVLEDQAFATVEDVTRQALGLSIGLDLASPRPIVPKTLAKLTLNDERRNMHPAISAVVSGLTFELPVNHDDLDERLRQAGNLTKVFQRRARRLTTALRGKSERATELRNAAGLLCEAVGAREGGIALAFAFMCMEAVLLEKSDTESLVARLSEAVAYRVGKSAEERRVLRSRVRSLYKARSTFVHTGAVPEDNRWDALRLAVRVLRRELEELRPEDRVSPLA